MKDFIPDHYNDTLLICKHLRRAVREGSYNKMVNYFIGLLTT